MILRPHLQKRKFGAKITGKFLHKHAVLGGVISQLSLSPRPHTFPGLDVYLANAVTCESVHSHFLTQFAINHQVHPISLLKPGIVVFS